MLQTRSRTTVAIPSVLLDAVDRAVSQGLARSRNEFLSTALRNELARCRRAAIDTAFAGMADDTDYQDEARHVAQEFAAADWEALGVDEERA